MTEFNAFSAILIGIAGGVHCVGMCGGIATAFTATLQKKQSKSLYILAYNLGRILSYSAAGALTGYVGNIATLPLNNGIAYLTLISGIMLVALALYLGQWWQGLRYLEQAGGFIWKRLQPLTKIFIPLKSPIHALGYGSLWGWLPCGLVYSVLIWAVASGGAQEGGLLMLSFALGTLPNLLLMGVFAARLSRFVANPIVRNIAGSLVVLFGLLMLYRAVLGEGI